jgi:hypothetical protein
MDHNSVEDDVQTSTWVRSQKMKNVEVEAKRPQVHQIMQIGFKYDIGDSFVIKLIHSVFFCARRGRLLTLVRDTQAHS